MYGNFCSDDRSQGNSRNVHYQSIDLDRTREANRPFDNGRSSNSRASNQTPTRPNEHRSFENIDSLDRPRSAGMKNLL